MLWDPSQCYMLLDRGRERAKPERLPVTFQEADAEVETDLHALLDEFNVAEEGTLVVPSEYLRGGDRQELTVTAAIMAGLQKTKAPPGLPGGAPPELKASWVFSY
jgi:hypothetical protein